MLTALAVCGKNASRLEHYDVDRISLIKHGRSKLALPGFRQLRAPFSEREAHSVDCRSLFKRFNLREGLATVTGNEIDKLMLSQLLEVVSVPMAVNKNRSRKNRRISNV